MAVGPCLYARRKLRRDRLEALRRNPSCRSHQAQRRDRRRRHPGQRGRLARHRARHQARALSARQRLRRAERARHHRRGDLVLARGAQARDGRPIATPACRSTADGRHRRGRRRRRRRADAPCRRAGLCRRAGAAAVLLQGRAGRRPGRLCRHHRAGDRATSRSRSTSITSRSSPACTGTSRW